MYAITTSIEQSQPVALFTPTTKAEERIVMQPFLHCLHQAKALIFALTTGSTELRTSQEASTLCLLWHVPHALLQS